MMKSKGNVAEDLKHLIRYYQQATFEFYDETGVKLGEKLDAIHACLEKDENSLDDYRKMIDDVVASHQELKQRISDLDHLMKRMQKLFVKQ